MSVPIVDATQRRGVGSVLGVGFGLALIAACIVFVMRQSAGRIDGDARLREAFELGTLPFHLEVVSAAKLFQGEDSVVLANPRAEPEPPKIEVPEKKDEPKTPQDSEKEAEPPKPRFDWSKLPVGDARPPRQVELTWYPSAMGEGQIRQQFGGGGFSMSMKDIGEEGGRTDLETGTLVWGAYAPVFVHERELEAGKTFRDSLRVNLSTPGQYCVMVVKWPRNSPGKKAHVDEILKALAPREPAETAR